MGKYMAWVRQLAIFEMTHKKNYMVLHGGLLILYTYCFFGKKIKITPPIPLLYFLEDNIHVG
jgi:hypothetical protein